MRIVIDLQGAQGHNRFRGIGRVTLSLALAMARQKGEHEIVLALNGLFPESIEEIRAEFDGLLSQSDIRVWQGPANVFYRAGNKGRRLAAELVRESFLASLHPDVVVLPSLLWEGMDDDVVTSIGLLPKQYPTAVVLHDIIPYLFKDNYLADPAVAAWYENKIDHLRRADLLLAVSEYSRQDAIRHLGRSEKESVYCGNSHDDFFRKIDISGGEKKRLRQTYGIRNNFLMYVGGNDPRKNVQGLIRAYALLPLSLRQSHQLLVIYDMDDAHRQTMFEFASQQGINDSDLVLEKFMPKEDLLALYNICKLFVFPSLYEGFGLPALEAMACGAPVIGANASSIPEIIGREDALFDPQSDEDIARKIQHVLTDVTFRTELAKYGLERAGEYSWDQSARRALRALEDLHAQQRRSHVALCETAETRPRLAFFSPIPPERTGVSEYSERLLLELSRYYDVEFISGQSSIDNPGVRENIPVRTVSWFLENARHYNRVLYHFGNSHFHEHMYEALRCVPGVVVMHDFFLSNYLGHTEAVTKGTCWTQGLYYSHGYRPVLERVQSTDHAIEIAKYPANKEVLDRAVGIVSHSDYNRELGRYWYGDRIVRNWAVIPFLRSPADLTQRKAARTALGIGDDEFLVCSFGFMTPSKLNDRLLTAWTQSSLGRSPSCRLVFVGELHAGDYGQKVSEIIAKSPCHEQVTITGWADDSTYHQYLRAADMAVQLRSMSRGETSAAIMDCLNYALPTIVNANGSFGELPKDAVEMLPETFDEAALVTALEKLYDDATMRRGLSERARALIVTDHAPRRCATRYHDAIEAAYRDAALCDRAAVNQIADIAVEYGLSERDLEELAQCIARNAVRNGSRQLLVDVSELVQRDVKTGIQRVVRAILTYLVLTPPEGYRVEPVYATMDEDGYRYARKFTCHFLGIPDGFTEDDPVDIENGDVFFGLDYLPHIVPRQEAFFTLLRCTGVRTYFLIHDLLPIQMPQFFGDGMSDFIARWISELAKSDGIVCVSRTVADQLLEWLTQQDFKRQRPLAVGWSHNGADLSSSVPTQGMPEGAKDVLSELSRRPAFLMVGTIEPRKGHAQTLAAFDLLWKAGIDINLVIVGKPGWMIEDLLDRLGSHPEMGKRLFWLQGISDEYLEKVYSVSACLLAASEGEGFGLPLIEAAQHKLPIIARDLPVFREVAAEHAFYFSGTAPDDLAQAVQQWVRLNQQGNAPTSGDMPWITWEKSAQNVVGIILGGNWYQIYDPKRAPTHPEE